MRVQSTRLWLARALASAEFGAVEDLCRWLTASEPEGDSPSVLRERCRHLVQCFLAWLGDGVPNHAERARSLFPDERLRVLAASCLQEYVKRELLLFQLTPNQYGELSILISWFFGLNDPSEAPVTGSPESLRIPQIGDLVSPLPPHLAVDGADRAPTEPSES
jgi:hypothetical protein